MIKKIGAKILAKFIHHKNQKWIRNPLYAQQKTFDFLIQKAKSTDFGREHGFNKIKDYKDFQALIILPWNISSYLIKKFVKKTSKPYISVQNIVKKLKK